MTGTTRATGPRRARVDLVVELDELARMIVDVTRRVTVGEPANWDRLADRLGRAARACRREVLTALDDDTGVDGSR
jgi:hypothetical protein